MLCMAAAKNIISPSSIGKRKDVSEENELIICTLQMLKFVLRTGISLVQVQICSTYNSNKALLYLFDTKYYVKKASINDIGRGIK
jgi:nitrite reductase/ring-hydroxylating ferredoxin subunit